MRQIAQGSAKNLYLNSAHPDHLFIEFSDRVSIFDYGALPDLIPHRARALKEFAEGIFQYFDESGIPHAYDADKSMPNLMALRGARHPAFPDTKAFPLEFLPVEVIFRWGVPAGSSLLKRDAGYVVGQKFQEPLIEFTTKLEDSDRLLSEEEAREMLKSPEIFSELKCLAAKVADNLQVFFKNKNLELWDGKIECAWDPNTHKLIVVDAMTPDELRLTLPGLKDLPLSKQLLRQWYASTEWSFDLRQMQEKFPDTWTLNPPPPPKMGNWRKEKFSELYVALADVVTGKEPQALLKWLKTERVAPKVFVLGTGGRESAEVWRLQKEGVEIVSSPEEADCLWVSKDGDLAEAATDKYQEKSFWTYGPRQAAAELEWSKEFGRVVAQEVGINIPRFSRNPEDLKSFNVPPVIKEDALAAGKGVVVPQNWEEAEAALKVACAKGNILLEEKLEGPEASLFFSIETGYYGVKSTYLGSAQDFKRRFAGDEGPNTGGMGAYSPHLLIEEKDVEVFRKWAEDSARYLAQSGKAFHGIIYLGLMKDKNKGWSLIEYNVRLGDPETQALVLSWDETSRLRSLLALDLMPAGKSFQQEGKNICLALVRSEYPQTAPKDFQLAEWNFPETKTLVKFDSGSLGGRVSYLVAQGKSFEEAGDQIFEALQNSPWKDSLEWRADIIP